MGYLNLISLLGVFVMLALAWMVSSHRTKVNWRLVVIGILLQMVFAAVLFQSQNWTFSRKFNGFNEIVSAVESGQFPESSVDAYFKQQNLEPFSMVAASVESGAELESDVDSQLAIPGQGMSIPRYPQGILFSSVNSVFEAINSYVAEGSHFVFDAYDVGGSPSEKALLMRTFVFGVLPTVIFFASLMAVLYYLGIMQVLIKSMAWVMQKTLGTSGPESMAAAANVLVGHTEAPLVIRPYVANMTRSELNALMVGGFATISGSLMVVFVSQGISAGHLLTASIISAPAALVIAKILQPEIETPAKITTVENEPEQAATNVIEAAAIGAGDGVKLAINITAMLIAFLALLAMLNAMLMGVGEGVEYVINLGRGNDPVDLQWSMNSLFATLFYPLAWVMGIESGDCAIAGEMLGTKVVVNEFIAYSELSKVVEQNAISDRTNVILTYALCGFSNFGAIGIQIGGIGPLAPSRRSDLAQLGLRAMFGGMLAACMTACMAGLMFGVLN